jgi:hypothetical protein
MQKEDKERVVAELTERLRTAETLIVADYRGLTMPRVRCGSTWIPGPIVLASVIRLM